MSQNLKKQTGEQKCGCGCAICDRDPNKSVSGAAHCGLHTRNCHASCKGGCV